MSGYWKDEFKGPLTDEETEVVRLHEDAHARAHARLAYPEGRCWIGTTTESPPKWEVSNGPVGRRGESCEWDSPQEAINYARKLGLAVLFEEDFRWD